MRFLKRIAGFLGFVKDEVRDGEGEEEEHVDHQLNSSDADVSRLNPNMPRKGFSVAVPVAVDRPQLGPIIVPCNGGAGGIQGLRWHARRLRVDEDGDVADEFLNETRRETLDQHERFPRFSIKYGTTPAKVRNQVLGLDGKVQQSIEYRGKLQWI